jgi:hypothetical protein
MRVAGALEQREHCCRDSLRLLDVQRVRCAPPDLQLGAGYPRGELLVGAADGGLGPVVAD